MVSTIKPQEMNFNTLLSFLRSRGFCPGCLLFERKKLDSPAGTPRINRFSSSIGFSIDSIYRKEIVKTSKKRRNVFFYVRLLTFSGCFSNFDYPKTINGTGLFFPFSVCRNR